VEIDEHIRHLVLVQDAARQAGGAGGQKKKKERAYKTSP
jgi:hypothetical protein